MELFKIQHFLRQIQAPILWSWIMYCGSLPSCWGTCCLHLQGVTFMTRRTTVWIYTYSLTRYTKCFNEWVYSALKLARHVSDLTSPSSGAFCTSCIRRLWYVVIRVLLDTCSRYEVTAGLKCWLKLVHWDHTVYLVGLYIYMCVCVCVCVCVWKIKIEASTGIKKCSHNFHLCTFAMRWLQTTKPK